MSAEQSPYISSESPARNSSLRKKIDVLSYKLSLTLHKKFPSVTPNEFSAFGTAGVLLGAAVLAASRGLDGQARELIKEVGVVLMAAGGTMDKVDGDTARMIEEESPGILDKDIGPVVDAVNDRFQEIGVGIIHALETKSLPGLLVAVTSSLPSLVRAYGEQRGIIFNETGGNTFKLLKWLEFFGTRGGRFGALIGGSYIGGKIQVTADRMVAAGNIATTIDRSVHLYKHWNDGKESPLPQEERKRAILRTKAIALCAGLGLGASVAAGYTIDRNFKK